MKLINFELSEPHFAIELIGMVEIWDLHNSLSFDGLNLSADSNTLVLQWAFEPQSNKTYRGCKLIFSGLKRLEISKRDDELPLTEDFYVAYITTISSRKQLSGEISMFVKRALDEEHSMLLVNFQNQRNIIVKAETVELLSLLH